MTIRHKSLMSLVIIISVVGSVFAGENKVRLILPTTIYSVHG